MSYCAYLPVDVIISAVSNLIQNKSDEVNVPLNSN